MKPFLGILLAATVLGGTPALLAGDRSAMRLGAELRASAGKDPSGGPLSFEARHDHRRGSCTGRLSFDEKGVAFESQTRKGHSWQWTWLDIQQFKLLDTGEVSLLTYKDNKWRLGADREFHLHVAAKELGAQVSPLLRSQLERRFVSGLGETDAAALWGIPVKHLLRISGTEGKLVVARDRIVYQTETPGDSRTWLFSDMESISTSGPFQLTITTHERARSHYGDRKGFNFELKEALSESRYNELWRRLEETKGLQILRSEKGIPDAR